MQHSLERDVAFIAGAKRRVLEEELKPYAEREAVIKRLIKEAE